MLAACCWLLASGCWLLAADGCFRLLLAGWLRLGTLMRFLPIVTQVFMWHAIFASLKEAGGGPSASQAPAIQGYTYPEFVVYYLLTMVARAFSSMRCNWSSNSRRLGRPVSASCRAWWLSCCERRWVSVMSL